MIETIIATLVAAGTSEMGKDLYKRIAVGLGALLRAKKAPASATEAVAKLEHGQIDQAALRAALSHLEPHELDAVADDVQALSEIKATVTNNANLDFRGATISGGEYSGNTVNFGKT